MQDLTPSFQLTIAYEEPDEAGWIVARVLEIRGAQSRGRTRKEARANAIDALQLMLRPDEGDPYVANGRIEQLDLIVAG